MWLLLWLLPPSRVVCLIGMHSRCTATAHCLTCCLKCTPQRGGTDANPAVRRCLVQVIDRILYKLDELVRPFVHKILVVIEPLLIDEDYYARVEGREIIANLSKAAGLATMIAAMRPDIDNIDE